MDDNLERLKLARANLLNAAEKSGLYQNIIKTNGKIVIGTGSMTPHVLFIGEAPGHTENKQGKPFIGASSKILHNWITSTGIANYAIINAVPIIPLDDNNKIRAPTKEEVEYFRPYTKALITALNPTYIIAIGKTSAVFLQTDFKLCKWIDNTGCIYHPAYYLRNGKNGVADFKTLMRNKPVEILDTYKTELEYQNKSQDEAVEDFITKIRAEKIDKKTFKYQDKTWKIDSHPYGHSDDIIVDETEIDSADCYLLVKTSSERIRIPGWCTKNQLKSTAARDIYRNGKPCHIVHDTNVNTLQCFRFPKKLVLKKDFTINKQLAENLGHTEMINGLLAGLHSFAKAGKIFFKDINQKDECVLGDKKVKIYTRTAMNDEDMLVYDDYYKKHPEIDLYVCCKIMGGKYTYLGYVTKDIVTDTRIVQMIGESSTTASKDIRRIFAEQYKPISDLIQIYESEKEKAKPIVQQNYIPLHVHTEYSIADGFGTIPYLVQTLKERGFKGCAITDHGTLGGALQFQRCMLAENLKPIIGMEAYLKFTLDKEEKGRYHSTILVKNQQGWKNLLKLNAFAVRDGFYYKPIITLDKLLEHHKGLVVTGGCMDGMVQKLLAANQPDKAKEVFLKFLSVFKDDFYMEMQPHDILNNQKHLQTIYGWCQDHNVKCIFTTDSHYPKPEDKKYHDAIKAIGLRKKYHESGFDDDCFYLMQQSEIEAKLKKTAGWMVKDNLYNNFLHNTNEIYDKCNFTIEPPIENDTLPKVTFEGISTKDKLKQMCVAGLSKYTPYKYEGKIKERLDMETDRMVEKNYENYFLIVSDLINWAKENDIRVGPGRGSCGASLAAWCLNITECDPIKYDLLFARFLSPIRRDAPDIDMDFMDTKRHLIFKYLQDKYGHDHCAKVITYSKFHPKSALRDVGRIFDIPVPEINKVCNVVLERSGGDARASLGLLDTFAEFAEAQNFQKKYPEASDIATKIEGHNRHCVNGNAHVLVPSDDGTACKEYKIKNLYKKGFKGKIRAYDFANDVLFFDNVLEIMYMGKKDIVEIQVKDKKLKLTEDHLVLTRKGWIEAGRLEIGDYIAIENSQNTMQYYSLESIEKTGLEEVYDIIMESNNHNFVCNKIIVHNCSVHAAGMVITERDISSYIPISKIHGEIVTSWEKMQTEDMKLVKFDILGLKTLSIIDDCIKSAKCELPKEFDDPRVFELFRKGDTGGIFQFQSIGMQKFAQNLQVENFHELYDATSLYRPGCISGQTRIAKHQYPEMFENNPIIRCRHSSNLKILEAGKKKFVESQACAFECGEKELFRIIDEEGNIIDASPDHKFLTDDGWKKLKDLRPGDEIYRAIPEDDSDKDEEIQS